MDGLTRGEVVKRRRRILHRVVTAYTRRKANSIIDHKSYQLLAQWRIVQIPSSLLIRNEHRSALALRTRTQAYQSASINFSIQVLQNRREIHLLLCLP